jgi:mycofactocin precursor
MPDPSVIDAPEEAPEAPPEPEDLVEDELLVEEVSIDGMCGVY